MTLDLEVKKIKGHFFVYDAPKGVIILAHRDKP